jgi:glycosyltransferase involved in cell wall biosynthesis
MAIEMAKYHDVWVLTRAENRAKIEAERGRNPLPNLNFVYFDLPSWARWWARRQTIEWHLYYYLWQACIYFVARRHHRRVGYELVHHVTFVKYWIPSFLVLIPAPLIWGPVGGGETAPRAFWLDFGPRGGFQEALRDLGRRLGEHDPFVRIATRQSASAWATTEETAVRMRRLGAKDVRLFSAVGLPEVEIEQLGRYAKVNKPPTRFISIGRLLHWKGFHLGLRGFAIANLPGTEYWIVGDGPERGRLEALATELGIQTQVRFFGALSRENALKILGEECHILVHPSLHDSGGYVCLEAMAAGRPVICLDLGGPAQQISEETGIKVPAMNPEQTTRDLASAMRRLAQDPELRARMADAGIRSVRQSCSWERKGRFWARLYEEVSDRR